MSVFKSSISKASPVPHAFSNLVEADEASRTLTIHLGRRKEIDEVFLVRFREEIARRMEGSDFQEIVFDLAGILVLSSSALGLIVAVSQGEAKVRVIHASHTAREDFLSTGLYRLIDLEPAPDPPRK